MDELNRKSVISLLKEDIYDILINTGVTISTAESCTGGNLASLFTYFSGSSTFYKGGVIAYANEVKTNLLGVDAKSLVEDGAVSESVVVEIVAVSSLNSDYRQDLKSLPLLQFDP